MRDRLLDAGQDLVQTKGFNAFSYGHLSQIVGIKTASIHYHFPSKEALGVAIAQRYRERFNIILSAIEADSPDAERRIADYCEQFLMTLKQGGRVCLCGMLASDYATLPEAVQVEVRSFFAENEAWLARILDAGRSDGDLSFVSDAKDVAMTLLSSLEGAMLDARVFDDEQRLERTIECWRRVLIGSPERKQIGA